MMSTAIFSQHPAICVPMYQSRATVPDNDGPQNAPPPPSSGAPSKPGSPVNKAPLAPAGVKAQASGTSITISWQAVDSSADTIVIDYSSDGSQYATLAILDDDELNFTATDLDEHKAYYFKMYAMNDKGTSPASAIVSAVTGA
jgi:hypothetical protein